MIPRGLDCWQWILEGLLTLLLAAPALWAEGERYISDMTQCRPASALGNGLAPEMWQLVPYESEAVSGTLVTAASFVHAPELRLPLGATGWHAVYLGYWHPEFAYDGGLTLKVKLSDAPAFRRIRDDSSPDTQDATYLREVYYDTADLTGRDLVLGNCSGPMGRPASLAYVRLVPLTPEQAAAAESDRRRSDTRNLVATIDGMSYFHLGEFARPEHILDLVEQYRYSDVGKVLWAANYGGTTNYPTSVPGASFMGGEGVRARLMGAEAGANEYVRGEKQCHDTLQSFAARGLVAQQLAAEHAHSLGLKFDAMFRLGVLGGVGPWRIMTGAFVRQHPQWRQVHRDGAVVEKASYAYPEVQAFQLAIIREALTKMDADGINLCFVRGPHFLLYETPVLEAFQARYGEDARQVPEDDPRLGEIRATFMTRFLREVREVLDEAGRKSGRRLELSVWVWPSAQKVWLGGTPLEEGLDVRGWFREGLLDSVICQEGVDQEFIKLGEEHGCRFVLFTGYRGAEAMSPETVTKAYASGVNQFAFWDTDCVQMYPSSWNWLRRIGHREEMADWPRFAPVDRLVRLTRVSGADVTQGLADAVYSGGEAPSRARPRPSPTASPTGSPRALSRAAPTG